MDENGLIDAVGELLYLGPTNIWSDRQCELDGHEAGHACLVVPDADSVLRLEEELTRRHGSPRTLVVHGAIDPMASERTGIPLLAPFGEQVVDMRAWTYGARWAGCGTIRDDDGAVRPVVLVAERRHVPGADEVSAGGSWVDRLIAITGWDPDRRTRFDWVAAETRLGTVLPSDYKELIERFGNGIFDDYLGILLPDSIAQISERRTRREEEYGNGIWEPHRPFPAPGGLLWWASTEHEQDFCWLTEYSDPDRWPVLHRDVGTLPWERFAGTTSEFVFRMLTDPEHPYSIHGAFGAHWFAAPQSD